jgi:hypothetical protein
MQEMADELPSEGEPSKNVPGQTDEPTPIRGGPHPAAAAPRASVLGPLRARPRARRPVAAGGGIP